MKTIGLVGLLLLVGALGVEADTAAPCGDTAITVGLAVDTAHTALEDVPGILANGGRIYFKTTLYITGSGQAAVDYLAEANRNVEFIPFTRFVPVASSNPLGNAGVHSFYVDVPDQVTYFRMEAWAFARCGAVNGTSTLHKFFSVGQDDVTFGSL